jgi:hypothetical protein
VIATLRARFEKQMKRHDGLDWGKVASRLEANAGKLAVLGRMEQTGGEPDVVGLDRKTGEYLFVDCSAQSPKDRRSLCYDRAALDSRKENKPKGSAMEAASKMGVELLSEEQYRELQELGEFDTTTSSWVATPAEVRKLGGALFCDRRFGRVFTYHNGAESVLRGAGGSGGC